MADSEELRGSTPVYTAKDILVRLDDKVEKMDLKIDGMQTSIQILVSQNLNERVVQLERDARRMEGAGFVLKALFGTSILATGLSLFAMLNSVGVF